MPFLSDRKRWLLSNHRPSKEPSRLVLDLSWQGWIWNLCGRQGRFSFHRRSYSTKSKLLRVIDLEIIETLHVYHHASHWYRKSIVCCQSHLVIWCLVPHLWKPCQGIHKLSLDRLSSNMLMVYSLLVLLQEISQLQVVYPPGWAEDTLCWSTWNLCQGHPSRVDPVCISHAAKLQEWAFKLTWKFILLSHGTLALACTRRYPAALHEYRSWFSSNISALERVWTWCAASLASTSWLSLTCWICQLWRSLVSWDQSYKVISNSFNLLL